ncbi:hypothetical protein HDU93_001233 [Gonapodya sp. JEL0774]|nr:hypothetical protein HDU93_001233 [Gonapodya sp. JEL0774]
MDEKADLEKLDTKEEFVVHEATNKLGVEIRGIERILPEDRTHTSMFANFSLWSSANMCLSTLTTGALGLTIFALSLKEAIAIVVAINFVCCLIVGYVATLGPRLGVRGMVLTRFTFGYYPGKFIALFNAISCVGWSCVNVIAGGLLLNALSDGKLPTWGGILLLSLLTIVVGVFGYQWVHAYERWAWLPLLVIFLILLGKCAPYITSVPDFNEDAAGHTGSILSYIGTIIGFVVISSLPNSRQKAIGWATTITDYNCAMPENSNRLVVGGLSFLGLFIPLTFVEILGLLVVSTAASNDAYAEVLGGVNTTGLLSFIMTDSLGGFGTFCMVLLALSTVANNIPNDYSLGLCMQVFGPRFFLKIKRHWWTLIGSVIFMIICTEDFFRGSKYDPTAWNSPDLLPYGIAASLAFVVGIVGAVVSMAQVWYIGPIAANFGMFGGDLGCEVGPGLALVTYLIARPLEKKFMGRYEH